MSESEAALHQAQAARRQAEERGPLIDSIVAPLKRARSENHLRQRIEAAFAERRGVQQ